MLTVVRPITYATLILVLAARAAVAAPPDLFVGRFVSETRQNFGSDDPGEYVIDVQRQGEKYTLSYSHKGAKMFTREGVQCSPDSEGYLSERPPGEAKTLCNAQEKNHASPLLSYSENGIKIPRIGTSYKTQYYARIQWAIRGFRRVQ